MGAVTKVKATPRVVAKPMAYISMASSSVTIHLVTVGGVVHITVPTVQLKQTFNQIDMCLPKQYIHKTHLLFQQASCPETVAHGVEATYFMALEDTV